MPEGLVHDAIPASPARPHIASAMAPLDDQGVDVALSHPRAHTAGTTVDRAAALTTPPARRTIPGPAGRGRGRRTDPGHACPSRGRRTVRLFPGRRTLRARARTGGG
ncbi:hypothetical protein [Streptomyces liangshanensis]|uniref:Uncharacterized protein n=1 Tax=Streptomyces liangshanensis TaxID=2717324 RepID=A0A6G9H7V5_9ACTN|nr:hypothetical protein [Streptomyces liangshanensis]QIQ06570.1 hypothetical protein HA039_33480 [Streptomyces liangshanensis]